MEPCGTHCLHDEDSRTCIERRRLREREREADTPHPRANTSGRGSTVTQVHATSRMGSVKSRRGFAEGYTVEPKANSQHSQPLMPEEIEKMRLGACPSSDCKPQFFNLKP